MERDWDRMVTSMTSQRSTGGTFARRTQWNHPSAALSFGQDAAKRYKRVDRAIAVIWKMLKAPELIEDVYLGAQYADGIAIESTAEMVAA